MSLHNATGVRPIKCSLPSAKNKIGFCKVPEKLLIEGEFVHDPNLEHQDASLQSIKTGWHKVIVTAKQSRTADGCLGLAGDLIVQLLEEDQIASNTFIVWQFSTKEKASSFLSYMQTEFVRQMLSLVKADHVIENFSFVPKVPLDDPWDNEKVLKYLNLESEWERARESKLLVLAKSRPSPRRTSTGALGAAMARSVHVSSPSLRE